MDLACGNDYGAALVARRARHVWALDIDGDTIASASKNWRSHNLSFMQGDATRLPFRSGSIDLVVAMETLEHIKDQTRLLQEMARVCSANGMVLISTPNKVEYSDARKYTNPFHIRELYLDDRGKWALSLQVEVERLTQIRQIFLYRILSRIGLLPK